jgi:hypothetical protein
MNATSQNPLRVPVRHRAGARVCTGIVAGVVAILVNTAMLIATDRFHVLTARGGLLTLLLKLIGPPTPPMATTWGFQQLFHRLVGVATAAVVYAVTLSGLRGAVLVKGLVAAAVVWLTNACVVLPLIGQGFAGHRVLTPLGMSVVAVAHTAFFVLNAWSSWSTARRSSASSDSRAKRPRPPRGQKRCGMHMHSGLTAFAEDASPVRYATALKVMRLSVADVFQIANGQDLTGKLNSQDP